MLELSDASERICFWLGVIGSINSFLLMLISLILFIKFIFSLLTSKFKPALLEHYNVATFIN